MFSKNNTKMNSRRECEKYNQYGIKKFNAGAASVLIASGFFFLGGAAQAADLASKQESNVENVAGNDKASSDSVKKSEEALVAATNATAQDNTSKQEVPKSEQAEVKVEKAVVNKAKLQEKINKLNDLFVTLAGRDLSETQQKLTVDAAIELNKAKDLIVAENATQAQVDAQTVAVENSISFLNKSLEATKAEDKKTEEKKADKKSDKEVAKENLEKAISEAKVVNQAANTFAAKSVKEEVQKAEIKAAVETAEKTIAKALDIFNSDSSTKQDSEKERKELERAIEAVYATMKRAGHKGELKGLLDGTTGTTTGARDLAPKVLTPVTNPESLTDSEIAAIEKEIRTSNPGLTNEDTITVQKTRGVQGAGFTTITYADGSGSVTFEPGQVMVASAGIKNLEQLSSSINWFNFASATITYKDGTVASPVRYYEDSTTTPGGRLYKQLDESTGSTGRTFEGYFSMYRDVVLGRDYTVDGVLYTKGTRLKSTDDAFLKMGIAKYEQHIYYSGNLQGQTDVKIPNAGTNPTTYTTKSLGEIYEVLQLGMKFDVPTRVEGYKLSATVSKLAPKEVEQDPQKGQGNRLRYYTSGDNGNSKAYGPTRVYDIVDAQNGGGRDVDVLLTTQDKTNSYLRTAGIHTNYRERREGDSDTNPTGPIREGLVAFSSSRDHANFGVSLYLEATYNGQLVPVNAVVADADESGRREYSQFETDGGAWEKLMEIHWDNRRLDSKGDAIVDGNGTSVLVDKNGNPYVDAAGNPMFINNKQTPTREDVVENGITEAKYYLTTASGAKVLVAEKDHMPVLDADGNPTILDSTGTRMTTTKEGLFRSTEVDRNGIKIKTREILDAEGRPILQGSAAMKGLEAFILPSGVKTFEIEYIGDPAKHKRRYFDTTDGKHEEIKKDFYDRSIMWGSEVDGRLAKEGGDDRATLKFKNPDKRPVQLANAGDLGDMKDAGYDPKQWVSSSAYGDKTFGSFWDAREDGYRLPIGLTQGVSNLSFYGNSTSSVSGVVGFIVTDGGDAPKSYGSAKHVIGNFNKVINNQEVTATQPYLGDQPGDPDFRSTVSEKSGDWVLDDLVMTNKYIETSLGAGETDPTKQVQVTNQKGDTGTFIITSSGNAVIRKEDGSQVAINQGDVLTTPDPKTGLPLVGIYNSTTQKLGVGAIPDEGEAQLLDPDAVDGTGKKIKGEYTLRQASDTEYVLYGVKANPGVNNKEAYLYGWVDFNGNGQFDKDERSELIKVTPGQKTYDVKFKNVAQLLDTSIDKAGVRLRIALEEQDIRESTGLAGSGEVEDFQTFVTHFPRGTRHETKDYQGQEQTIKVPTSAMFIANGKSKDSGYKNWVQINNVELSPKIVLTDKIVNPNTVTTLDPNAEKDKTDLGTKGIISSLRKNPDGSIYTNAEGKVFIDKKDATVLSGKLVQVKDKNNKVLGTALEVVNPNNNKTEYLMSEYTEYDSVGNKVGIYKINPATAGDNKEGTGGFYETTVTFKPEIGYVGRAKGIAIRAWDDNNNSTGWEASTQTIAASAASTTLADKDKISGNVNNGVNNYKSMDTIYVPTVIDIKPVGKDETTIDEQGKKQSATPRIPDHGTVESINNEHIDEAKIDKAHVLIDKSKPITFSEVKNIPGKLYEVDTPVDKETTLTYEDGGTETFKPADKIPAGTEIAKNGAITITGSGGVTVSGVRIDSEGTTNSPNKVPAGAVLEGALPTAPSPITVLRNGKEVTVNTGEKLQVGDQLVTPLPIVSGAQKTTWKLTLQKGDVIPKSYSTLKPRLVDETSVDKLIGNKGDSLTVDNTSYVNYNNIIPKGTRTVGKTVPLTDLTLPKATHVNPTTGEVTTVERRYTKIDIENGIIEIENEGTYKLVPKTTTNEKGETVYEDATVVFTPHPSFVGVGTGVTIKQPDVDYDNPDATDSVRRRYGTDYGYATYTPTVTPNLTATITRKIHYVYEGDTTTAPKDKTPILTIDGKPVTNEQTLTYNRDYIVMSQDGQTEKDITVATEMTLESPITVDRYVRKATGEVVKEATQVTQLKPGDVVKAGTQLPAGTVIVGAWKSINPENDHFTNIISPTLKGYTAEVQLPETEYTKSEKNGVQSHVRSSNQTPVGVYTPTIKDGKVNTQDVGSYEPMVSAVRADNKDDFDVYVYYKADKQVARVVYIDMDAASNADQGVLETHTGSTLEANKSATDTITKDETLYGDSATRIKYSTAATIAKYEAMGYELKRDGFTNDDDGNRIVGGRKFDEESVADSENAGEKAQNQTFYVFLGHKRDTGAKTERADVTRTINYKYKKDGSKAAESVTETLNFTRNITIDMALAAAAFPEDTATFNAENIKATPEEKQAAQAKYAEVEKQYNAAAEKVKEDATTAQALATADKDVTTTEKALADAKKANNSLVITSESTQAQKDAKAVVEAALQAAQTAYDNALAARNTARTNYLAAANSDLAKAVITTQKALEAENAKVAAAKAEYEAKVKDNNASDADKNAALTKFTDAIALAKTAAVNATAAQKAFTDAKDEKEALNDAKVAEAVKNQAIQDRANTTQAAKEAARQAYYDAVIAKVKEESKKETPDKNKVAAVSFGEWKALGSSATNLPTNEQLSEAEKQSDNAFNHVTSPTITGYLADKVAIDKTDAIDPLADDYEVDVFYEQGEQRAIVKFVEVDANNPDTVITPGVAEDLVEIGKTGDNFATLNTAAVKAAIKKLEDKGYTLVSDGFENPGTGVSNTTFDNDPKKDQEFVVKVKAKVVDIPSFDPTKPVSNDNPKPTPGVIPIDPSNPSGPKWTEDLIKAVKVQEEVTRTIKYVYEDGTEVPADKLADVADKKVKTVKFTRPGKINVVTGEITYGDWSADQTFETVTSPTIENYTAVVAGVTPATDTVPTKTVAATDKDFEEVVVYKTKSITVDPNPVDPNEDPDPNKVVENDPKKRTLKELGLVEEVKHTIHYVYEDGTKADEDVVQTLTYTRTAKIDPVTGAVSDYSTWTPKKGDDFTAVTSPAKEGYIVSKATSTAINDVPATADDTEETIIYRKLGSYVPVVPEGVTVPPGTDTTSKVYPKNPNDPTKPGTPTTTIPEIPGTTPVGPDGTPLTKNPNGGYDLPPIPTDPTQNTTITYVKDGSQVAVVHFVDEKGNSVNESVVETGDTGKEISKSNVDAVKAKLEAKGYTVVEPTDALYTTDKEGFYKEATRTFDAVSDKSTGAANEKVPSQQYYVIVKAKDLPVDPTKPLDPNDNPVDPTNPTPENPTKPRDPNTSVTPKPEDKVPNDPKGRTYGELGLVEQVTRTINYVKNDGSKAAEPVKETLTFTRKAKINAVTGEVTYLDNDGNATTKEAAPWTPVNNDTTFDKVTSPSVTDYTPTVAEVPAKENVTATDEDIVETVVYNPTKVTVTPNDPNVDPEKPLNPNDPNGLKYKDLKLTEEVVRTITYTYADDVADTTKRGTDAAPKHETTVSFTRTATVNQATGEVTYGDWTAVNNDTTLEGKTELPVITGYVATGDVESAKKDVANVTATDKDIVEKVVYKDLGKYVPVVPEGTTPPTITDPKYPNNPTDPTKPGEPTTTIPNVPGLTPLDPSTGKPLEPKDPNDLTKGYKPPVPQDPSKDTNIVYVADGSQVTVVHFVDEDGKAVHTSFVEAGDAGSKFTKAGEVTKVVDELKAAGYVVVPNKAGQAEYPGEAGVFDSVDDKGKDGVSQVYYVTVAKTIPVTPTTPQNPNEEPKNPNPGDPIDPKNPNGPKWTKEALDKLNNIKSVTRTITYVKDGTDEEVSTTEAPKVTNKVSFTRTVIVNPKDGSVVGYDTNGDGVADVPATDTTSGWAAAGTAKFAEVKSPVVKGYVVKPNQDTQGDLVEADGSKVKASATDLTVDSANQDLKVRYVPVGTWTPKVPEGETPIDPIPYPNDPTDPGKVVDPNKPTDPNDPNKPSVPVVPHIPGTTPKDPNGNPLKPVDPEDPTKGYVPPTPTTPTENTVIEYVKDDQKAVTKFKDPSGNPIPGVNNIEEKGKSGEPLTKATEVTNEIAKLIAKGYDLVSNNYGKDNNGNFDKDSGKDQEYTVVLTPHVEPIKPFDPTNPNDPNTPKPGQPIDPNNPDGPKWTEELIKSLETTKHVNRTISYVDKDGNKVEYTDKDGNKSTADVTDKVTFTREAKINVVTGTIEYGKWTPVNNDTTFDKVTSPVVPGYVLKDPAQKEVAETTGLTENSEDENIKVVYVKVGSIVPKIPDGETPSTPATPTPYNNVPNEPGKVVTPDPTKPTDPQDPNSPKVPVIPHVPGRTPQVPKDPNKPFDPDTNPLVPLTPVDPKDPTKGYEVPPVPTDPTKNIEIEYVKDEQNAVTKFVDPQGNPIPGFDKITETGKSGEPLTKANEIATKIAELQKLGYVVVSNNYGKDNNGNFDKDKSVDQEYTVVVKPVIVPVNPQPGQPIDPENPNGPKWDENLIKQLDTKREVKRTITYVDEFGNTVSKQVDDKVTFTRDAKINTVTREITYGDWKASNDDTTFDKVTSPSLKGYVLKDASQKEVAATTGLTPDSKDENIVVVYKKLGSWIPKVPEGETPIDPIPYPNDPTDPTKPGTDKPRIPEIPGHTPLVPTDPTKPVSPTNPLKPLDPSPQGGYEVPNVPTDPSKDTPIEYVKDGQRAITNFVDKDGNVVAPSVIDSGKSNTSFTKDKDVAATVAKLISQGYDVVSNDYPTNGKFDNDDKVDQYFNVVVTPHVEPVKPFDPENPQDPNRPQPNQPIDPNNPEGPKWTEELINKLETTKHVNRTIIYINENGDTVAKKVTDKVTFTREAKVNTVTKEITYGEWKAVNNDTTFDAVDSPVVPGYVLKDAAQKQVAATTGLTSDSKDENITVVYTKLGSWVPKVPEGETPIDPIPYPNDPKDPTKPGTPTPTPVVPYVPGTTPQVPTDPTKPVGPNNPLVPLKPVDPQDPTKGYEVPPVPTKPGTDTPIVYVKDGQKAIVNFVDENGNTVAASILETGKSGASFTKGSSVTSTIAELVVKGYEVVSNDYPTNGKFDNDDNVDQVYTVVVKPVTKPIVTPEPGKPINPDNPEGPKFGEEEISTEKVVTRTVKYVDEKGTVIYTTHKEKLKFTRTASVNSVTKKVTYGDWVAVNGDDTLDAVTSPVIKGYVLKAGQPKVVAERAGLNGDSPSDEFTVVYTKLGSWVPKVPEGATPIKPTPYPNDPTDPTKPGTDKPIVPQVPGTTPQVPQDPTKPVGPNNPLVPLKPVDPKDPSKGYEVPPVPTNPGADTPIYYVTDKQKAITNFVDNNGKVVSTPVVDEGDSGSKFTKSGDVESKIKELVKKGYVVTSNEYPSDDKDRVFDKDKDKDQIFNVTLTPLIVPTDPNSPDKPQVPTDPTKPVGPNNPLKPATPSTPEPGKPVFPEDPNSPVWPDTVKDLVTESSATRTITYVDQNGKEVAATHTETIKFKRSAKVNLVTGEITYGEWTVVGGDTILDGNKLPKVDGYIARGGDIKESQEDIKATVGANITQTVVYDKLGSWVPKVPEGATPVPPITYPNDPTDPTKPGTDKPHVPYVPGFIPVGPDGTPLKPVDPKDPSKGYEVPNVPADPTKDTPISYVPVNPDRPTPTPVTPEQPEGPATPATPKAPAKAGRLANTGTTETNTGLAGLGMAIFGGLLAAAKRRKEKK